MDTLVIHFYLPESSGHCYRLKAGYLAKLRETRTPKHEIEGFV